MISILIPTYNYNVYPLVMELKKQADLANIEYEIIVLDDASSITIQENLAINNFKKCLYLSNESNLGRANNINKLIGLSKFDYCLILDCDVFPKKDDFISNYIIEVFLKKDVVYGGIAYKSELPLPKEILRWKYGHKREAITLEKRIKNPYQYLLTSNILICKSKLENNFFNKDIINYGYEDLEFAKKLEAKNISVSNIKNEVYHLNLETSVEFLQKTEKALQNLYFLEKTGILPKKSTKVSKLHSILKQIYLDRLVTKIYPFTKSILKQNLLSKNPNLFIFDVYKILFYCKISK